MWSYCIVFDETLKKNAPTTLPTWRTDTMKPRCTWHISQAEKQRLMTDETSDHK